MRSRPQMPGNHRNCTAPRQAGRLHSIWRPRSLAPVAMAASEKEVADFKKQVRSTTDRDRVMSVKSHCLRELVVRCWNVHCWVAVTALPSVGHLALYPHSGRAKYTSPARPPISTCEHSSRECRLTSRDSGCSKRECHHRLAIDVLCPCSECANGLDRHTGGNSAWLHAWVCSPLAVYPSDAELTST
jgi:hypothetical protein